MARCHNKRISIYLKRMMHKLLFRDQKGKYVVTSKWIYMIKHVVDESVKKYKMRSIDRGFSQTVGLVYDETLDPVNPIHYHP
jgi:HJR/Mrr/RecB family endonuclease